jgi:hypothetical protein
MPYNDFQFAKIKRDKQFCTVWHQQGHTNKKGGGGGQEPISEERLASGFGCTPSTGPAVLCYKFIHSTADWQLSHVLDFREEQRDSPEQDCPRVISLHRQAG